MTNKTYARVLNGLVREFPVTETQIKNRGHNIKDYTEVTFSPKPSYGVHQALTENLTVIGSSVNVSYTVIDLTFDGLLIKIHRTPVPTERRATDVLASSIDPQLLVAFNILSNQATQSYLDNWAISKGFVSIDQAVSFTSSGISEYAKQAKEAKTLRDTVWDAYEKYVTEIKADSVALPRSRAAFLEKLPSIS